MLDEQRVGAHHLRQLLGGGEDDDLGRSLAVDAISDPSDRPDLRVRDPSDGEQRGHLGQLAQRSHDAQVFARGMHLYLADERHPVRQAADADPTLPDAAALDLVEECQQPGLALGDVRDRLFDSEHKGIRILTGHPQGGKALDPAQPRAELIGGLARAASHVAGFVRVGRVRHGYHGPLSPGGHPPIRYVHPR